MDFYHSHEFSRIKVTTSKGWQRLAKLIGDEKKFTLDIDLDFFFTNGDKISKKSYRKDFDDIESTGRVRETPGIILPREAYGDEKIRKVVGKLNTEFRSIRKRVQTFLRGLATLYKRG